MDPESAVRRGARKIAEALGVAGERARNEAEPCGLTPRELDDIKRSLEELL